MRAVILGTTALALCLAGALGVLHAADAPAVTFAVLRGDGILIPIATRSGTRWTHTWPVPIKAADVPLGLDGIPKRWWGKPGAVTTWHAWQIDGTVSSIDASISLASSASTSSMHTTPRPPFEAAIFAFSTRPSSRWPRRFVSTFMRRACSAVSAKKCARPLTSCTVLDECTRLILCHVARSK